MTQRDLCDQLHEFIDGELTESQSEAFRDHLAGCEACEAELHYVLQLSASSGELAALPALAPPPAPVSIASHRRWRRAALVAAPVLAAAAVLLLLLRGGGPETTAQPDAPRLAVAPTRAVEQRLSWPGADQYRPYSVDRAGGAGTAGAEPPSLAVVAALEAAGDWRGVATAFLLDRDWNRAATYLDRAPPNVDVRLERAVVALGQGRPEAALELVDDQLADEPDNAPALWNRALVLRELGLPLTAAASFERVAELGEPGWAEEARLRANALRAARQERIQASQAVWAAARAWIAGGEAPPVDVMLRDPGLARGFVYDLVRSSPSRARLDKLKGLVFAIDEHYADARLREMVANVETADFAKRAPLATRYGALVLTPDAAEDIESLAREARDAGFPDIAAGVLLREGGRLELDEVALYRTLVGDDPWLQLIAVEQSARRRLETSDALGAEAELLRALNRCGPAVLEFRCGRLEVVLSSAYLMLHRGAEAEVWLRAARERSSRTGDWFLEFLALRQLSELSFSRDNVSARGMSVSRAFMDEAIAAAPDDCAQRYRADTMVSRALLAQRRFASAQERLVRGRAAEIACPAAPPDLERVFLMAQVAEALGDDALSEQAVAAIGELRASDDLQPAAESALDYFEGRALLRRRPEEALRMVRQARTSASRLRDSAVLAQKIWSYAHTTLALEAGARGAAPDVLRLLAEVSELPAPTRCAVGVAVDSAVVVAVVGANGDAEVVVRPLRGAEVVTASIVPQRFRDALDGCDRVDVLARPPIMGAADLLPGDIAWRYRIGAARTKGLEAPVRRLLVTDVEPPGALRLAPLLPARALASTEAATVLRGPAATPARVLSAMRDANLVEIHAHGLVDVGVSDAGLIALSPDASGRYALTARDVRAAELRGSPVVLLAACHASAGARLAHESWSLATAFVDAGARAVIASPAPLPDASAAAAFASLRSEILRGVDAANALRNLRKAEPRSPWLDRLVVFQ